MDRANARAQARIEYKVIRRDGSEEIVSETHYDGAEAQAVWESIRHQFSEAQEEEDG